MKTLLSFIVFLFFISIATTVYAGGYWGSYNGLGYGNNSLFGTLGGGHSLFGSLGPGSSKDYWGDGYRDKRLNDGNRGHYRRHRYSGCGIATGYISAPGYIEYIPPPVYYIPGPVNYDTAPEYSEPAPVYEPKTVSDVPAPAVNAPVPAVSAPLTVATTDNVPKGHWEIQKIWVPDNKSSWIEKYYDEKRDVLVLSNREQKLGTNGHWAEREIWVED
jgi:hypothetical protein